MSELTNEQFENLLRLAVLLVHLTDDELGQYHDGATDEVTIARIVVHLRQCQMCSGRSALMKLAVLPESSKVTQPVSKQLKSLAARLTDLIRGKYQNEEKGQIQLGLIDWGLIFNGGAAGLDRMELRNFETLTVQGANEIYRFLTVFEEDEATGEIYLLMSAYGEQRGPVYCWVVNEEQVELPFVPVKAGAYRYRAYLTDREVPLPDNILADLEINTDERGKERKQLLVAFLDALEAGAVPY